ncbi:hypothetical protein OIE52_32745 [Streptomyces canus]|nr:hypothetical protein [Streptomyces canus]
MKVRHEIACVEWTLADAATAATAQLRDDSAPSARFAQGVLL